LEYATKLIASENNPSKSILQNCWQNYNKYRTGSEPFVIKNTKITEIIGNNFIKPNQIYFTTPYWQTKSLNINTNLQEKLLKLNSNFVADEIDDIILKYDGKKIIYTDGSVKDGKAGIAIYFQDDESIYQYRLTDGTPINSAELVAIKKALELSIDSNQSSIAIFTDSLSAINKLSEINDKSGSDQMNEIHILVRRFQEQNRTIDLVWIPSHRGIHGNEVADKNAKDALNHPQVDIEISKTVDDIKQLIDIHTINQWQLMFNQSITGAEYKKINPTITKKIKYSCANRQQETCITRLRLGKCCLNKYLYQINRHLDGLCDKCRVPETIEHALTSCETNKDLIETLKKICMEMKMIFELKTILNSNKCIDCIADYFIHKIKRRI
jgi:ribonuclease HI